MSLLDDLLDDLKLESDQLWNAVAALDADAWQTPTPAAGWTVATTVAHVLWTDEVAVVAATDEDAWDALVHDAIQDPTGYVDQQAIEVARLSPQAMLARWGKAREALPAALRGVPKGQKMPWFGPPMSPTSMATARFMETWAHALDVYDALGIEPEQSDRVRHVAHLGVRTRDYAYSVHELPPPSEEFRIDLVSPSEEQWSWGPEDAAQTVTGSAWDFCLLVTQRVHRDDTDLVASGADAEQWLTIAQAFAGPAGEGRPTR
jgi:uncharacterized protein (TIGR03084 family)